MSQYNPFANPASSSSQPTTDAQKTAATVAAVKTACAGAARNLLASYRTAMQLVNASSYTLADGSQLSAAAIYAAMDAANAIDPTVPSAATVQTVAVMVKTLVNTIAPGTIIDAIPVGTIILPG